MIIVSRGDIIALKLEHWGVCVPNYKEMYFMLFQSATQAITILQEAQRQTEEMYLSAEQPDMKMLALSEQDLNEHPEEK